jgi:hypothetical protein
VLGIQGEFSELWLSLFLGQCLTPDNFFRTASQIPVCDKVWEGVHKWKNVSWTIEISAECRESQPFIENIAVHNLNILSPVYIQANILGYNFNLEDISGKFKAGVIDTLEPLLKETHNPWIHWGPGKFTLSGLLSHVINLNIPAGETRIKCPR